MNSTVAPDSEGLVAYCKFDQSTEFDVENNSELVDQFPGFVRDVLKLNREE